MTMRELIEKAIEDGNMSLASRVRRLGGVDALSDRDVERFCKQFHLEPQTNWFTEVRRAWEALHSRLMERAEANEYHLGEMAEACSNGVEDATAFEDGICEAAENLLSVYAQADKRDLSGSKAAEWGEVARRELAYYGRQ